MIERVSEGFAMYDLKARVEKEIEDLKYMIRESRKVLRQKKPGSLAVKTVKGTAYYYESKTRDRTVRQKYLGTADDERVGAFIILKVMEAKQKVMIGDLRILEGIKNDLGDYSTDVILAKLGEKYRTAFWGVDELRELKRSAGRLPWEVKNEYQETAENEGKVFDRDVITCDGNRVRSKSECIIYDILKASHIRFQYEPALYFHDEDYNEFAIHPDFYIDCKDGSNIIIEHLGMLNDQGYADTQEHKLRMYHINGYDLGHNLILTSDNNTFGVDSSFISDMIAHVVLPRAKTAE